MERIKNFVLPENTNRLYKEEAISSIGLTREVAEKINELVDAYNSLSAEDLRWKQTQEGIIRKGVLYMKDNLVNTLQSLYDLLQQQGFVDSRIRTHTAELTARVNNLLSKVKEGSTTLDAELIDLRVGADGKIYSTAGSAVREQFENLHITVGEPPSADVGLGYGTLENNTGSMNTYVGFMSGNANTEGKENTGMGANAGRNITSGRANVSIGYESAVENTTESGFTAVGAFTKVNTYGTAIGDEAKATGVRSVAVGSFVEASGRGGVAIGCDSNGNSAKASLDNEIVLGTNLHKVKIPGDVVTPKFVSSVPNTTFTDIILPDLSQWTPSGAVEWSSGWKFSASASIKTPILTTKGKNYYIALTVSNALTLNAEVKPVTFRMGSSSISIFGANDANWKVMLEADSTGEIDLIISAEGWTGTITSVSVKEVESFPTPTVSVENRRLHCSSSNIVLGTGHSKIANGENNTGLGFDSQRSLTTAIGNTAVGYKAQENTSQGSHNTAVGEIAQRDLTTGMYNNAVGYASQNHITSGCWNNAMGNESQRDLTTGNNNVSIGRRTHNSITTGSQNVAIGSQAGFVRGETPIPTVDAFNQVLIGFQATQTTQERADGLIAIGAQANGKTNAIAIGAGAMANGKGCIAIGTASDGTPAMVEGENLAYIATPAHTVILAGHQIIFAEDGTVHWQLWEG